MNNILHGWYTFISGSGLNFVPYSKFYETLLYEGYRLNTCETCFKLSQLDQNNNIACIFCSKKK